MNCAARPGGETGRHSGLKIRRHPEKERAGSIPARGTSTAWVYIHRQHKSLAMRCVLCWYVVGRNVSCPKITALFPEKRAVLLRLFLLMRGCLTRDAGGAAGAGFVPMVCMVFLQRNMERKCCGFYRWRRSWVERRLGGVLGVLCGAQKVPRICTIRTLSALCGRAA